MRPTLDEFLEYADEQFVDFAPETMILSNGGTRRRAILAGIPTESNDYARWTREQMVDCFDLIFRHRVRHLVSVILAETNFAEVTPKYRDRILAWAEWGLAGPEALADYRSRGWRVRLIGGDFSSRLVQLSELLRKATDANTGPTVWFTVASHPDTQWDLVFKAAQQPGVVSRYDAIRLIFGEDIPLASLFLGSGKPQIFSSIVPPILIGHMQCYWRQHLGYDLDQETFRTVIYDYAVNRDTWQADKSGRAAEILRYQDYWKNPPVIGLGRRAGPFWIPETKAFEESSIEVVP